jgi:iron(III) transport system ATP-binding protein
LAGEIVINERAVFNAADGTFVPPERRRIGMVFQSYAIWPHMTVAENVEYPLAGEASRKERSIKVGEIVTSGLGELIARAQLERRTAAWVLARARPPSRRFFCLTSRSAT